MPDRPKTVSGSLNLIGSNFKKAPQYDVSMRAKRESAFKNSLKVDFNINVRQGRTYSKTFNK